MTIIKGEIESLKRIKAELNQKGITRFDSVGSIKFFIKNYDIERQKIFNQIEHDLNNEIETLETARIEFQKQYDILKVEETHRLNSRIDKLNSKYSLINSRNSNTLIKAFCLPLLLILKLKKTRLEKNFNKIILKNTFEAAQKVNKKNNAIKQYSNNRKEIIFKRSLPKIKELSHTKDVINGLYPQIAGAIGENMVVNELKKLSDKNILFNDFSINFKSPIYNRKEDDRIFSIQIDHLLITNAGIFIIETKNWSRKSIENFDLRSPIEQIRRTSYALFVILNNGKKNSGPQLKRHHWGDRQIPIRNVVVIINNKPKENFKYVKVTSLNELNRYITYFEPIFDDLEVYKIYEYLEMIKN